MNTTGSISITWVNSLDDLTYISVVTTAWVIPEVKLAFVADFAADVKFVPLLAMADGRGMIEVPTWSPEEPKEMTALDIVTAGAPNEMVWLPTASPAEQGVKVWPPYVNADLG